VPTQAAGRRRTRFARPPGSPGRRTSWTDPRAFSSQDWAGALPRKKETWGVWGTMAREGFAICPGRGLGQESVGPRRREVGIQGMTLKVASVGAGGKGVTAGWPLFLCTPGRAAGCTPGRAEAAPGTRASSRARRSRTIGLGSVFPRRPSSRARHYGPVHVLRKHLGPVRADGGRKDVHAQCRGKAGAPGPGFRACGGGQVESAGRSERSPAAGTTCGVFSTEGAPSELPVQIRERARGAGSWSSNRRLDDDPGSLPLDARNSSQVIRADCAAG